MSISKYRKRRSKISGFSLLSLMAVSCQLANSINFFSKVPKKNDDENSKRHSAQALNFSFFMSILIDF